MPVRCIPPESGRGLVQRWKKTMEFTPDLDERAAILNVVAQPTRLRLFYLLDQLGEVCVCDIAEILVYQTGSESSAVQKRQIQQIRQELGLDRPIVAQYLDWVAGAVRGDFGQSYLQRRPVADILKERFPRSMELAVLTLLIAIVWAVPLGVISAVRQNGPLDYLARLVSLSGLSLPLFFNFPRAQTLVSGRAVGKPVHSLLYRWLPSFRAAGESTRCGDRYHWPTAGALCPRACFRRGY